MLTLVERGDITGMSFGFRALCEEWNIAQKPYLRTVTAAEPVKSPITSMPAYPESGGIAHRSLFAQHLNYARQEIIVIAGLNWRVVICGGL